MILNIGKVSENVKFAVTKRVSTDCGYCGEEMKSALITFTIITKPENMHEFSQDGSSISYQEVPLLYTLSAPIVWEPSTEAQMEFESIQLDEQVAEYELNIGYDDSCNCDGTAEGGDYTTHTNIRLPGFDVVGFQNKPTHTMIHCTNFAIMVDLEDVEWDDIYGCGGGRVDWESEDRLRVVKNIEKLPKILKEML